MPPIEMKIATIWIEAEEWAPGEWHPDDDNSDVIVTSSDGTRWVASFFTYRNVESLRRKNQQTGECLAGGYFWASEMVLIDTLTRARIEQVIQQLLAGGQFPLVFSSIGIEETDGDEPNGNGSDALPAKVSDGLRATALLAGRTVVRLQRPDDGSIVVEFNDGSRLIIDRTPRGLELSVT